MMKEKMTRLKQYAIFIYYRNMNSMREKRLRKQRERLQMELMSGSIRRVK
ncbi:MAG: hypothetical protein OEU95_00245 [Nitrospirota bacterium]|nr:hypothetical protein [Nitrospirota bacterium]